MSRGHYRHDPAISFDCQASDIPVDQTPLATRRAA